MIDILLGKNTPKVSQFDHDSLTVFGVGTELREAEWRGVVRQLLAQGLLAVEPDYGALVLTEASREVLHREQRRSRCGASPSGRPGRPGRSQAAAARRPRRRRGRAARGGRGDCSSSCARWRAAAAREQGVPAYVIFHDTTLRQIAAEAPATLAELATVSGVGEAKLAKYGQQILDLVAAAGAGTGAQERSPAARSRSASSIARWNVG